MIGRIQKQMLPFPVAEIAPDGQAVREAAVLIALTRKQDPGVVLTKRSEELNNHAGEVAFPGGMWEQHDFSLKDTALRESEEEISLPRSEVELIATLPKCLTRLRVPVTPYVGIIEPELNLQPDPFELDDVFEVPLSFFLNEENLEYRQFDLASGSYRMPCYHYQGFVIWGFTLGVLVDFLNIAMEAGLTLKYPPAIQ